MSDEAIAGARVRWHQERLERIMEKPLGEHDADALALQRYALEQYASIKLRERAAELAPPAPPAPPAPLVCPVDLEWEELELEPEEPEGFAQWEDYWVLEDGVFIGQDSYGDFYRLDEDGDEDYQIYFDFNRDSAEESYAKCLAENDDYWAEMIYDMARSEAAEAEDEILLEYSSCEEDDIGIPVHKLPQSLKDAAGGIEGVYRDR